MLAAGGLLALVLAGLLLDGALSSSKDEGEDPTEGSDDEFVDADDAAPDGDGSVTMTEGSALADLLFGTGDSDEIDGQGGDDTVSGGDGDDFLRGGSGDDALNGEDGQDTLDGGAGDDHLSLGAGDFGTGGDGADIFEVTDIAENADGDTVACVTDFEVGFDRLILDFDGADYDAPDISFDIDSDPGNTLVLANDLPVALLEGVSALDEDDVLIRMLGDVVPLPEGWTPAEDTSGDSIVGGAQDDTLTGGPGNDTLIGGPGNDVLEGLSGDDLLNGGTGQDMNDVRGSVQGLFADHNQDAITGSFNDDLLPGSAGTDQTWGDEGNDALQGNQGDDELHGDTGNDTLLGGSGMDFLSGGEGNDSLSGGTETDFLFGNDGDDTLLGDEGGDYLQGGFGADSISGGDGDDRIDGTFSSNPSNLFGPFDEDTGDTLDGGEGDDVIVVGANDEATGGAGADSFVTGSYIETGAAAGVVTDFDPDLDVIEVMYDPALTPHPVISVEAFADGSGASIVMNGQVILRVTGGQGLSAADVELREVTFADGSATA